MKKSIIALVVVAALIVLLTPRLVGHLAEKSVNESLMWVGGEQSALVITTTEFERRWFTSSGQHRIETPQSELPVLVVDTRLDHGVIPISSLVRDNGSLMPGLGNAISTVSRELVDGSVELLPITIYTSVGLSGSLESQLIIEASGADTTDARIDWGHSEFVISSDPVEQSFGAHGALTSFAAKTDEATVIVGRLDVDFEVAQTQYGYMVGSVMLALDSISEIGAEQTLTAGPMSIESNSSIEDGRLDGDLVLNIEDSPSALGGRGGMQVAARLENADAAAFGVVVEGLDAMTAAQGYGNEFAEFEAALVSLAAAGMQLHFDQLDILMPQGKITSRFDVALEPSDDPYYSWETAMTLATGSADLSLPKALVDMATQYDPNLHGVIGMGYLRRRDDFYLMEASVEDSVLTINGAPMPLPLPGL